jgi:hypothetical protein
MRILPSIVAPSATLVAFCDSKMTGCGGIRSQLICDELVWDRAIFIRANMMLLSNSAIEPMIFLAELF